MKAGNTDSPKLRANAKTEYEASVAKVESDRSKWLLAMETEKKDADEQWDALASKIDTSNMTGRDLSALLSQTPTSDGLAVNSPNAQVDNFNKSLTNLQNTKFTFNSTDYREEIAGYRSSGQPVVKSDSGFDFSALNKLTAIQTVKSFLTDPFSTQSSYSIFNPDIKAPDTSVTGINLDKAFTNSFNGVQNMAYVTGTTDAADKIAKDYYDSIVNQYKFNFKKEVLDARREAALDHFMQVEFNLNKSQTEDALAGIVTLKGNVNVKKARGDYLAKLSDIDLLTPEERDAYTKNKCYTNISICSSFMEENKDLKSITVENGQIVIKREISDGTIHKGGGEKEYELVGGYSSGKQIDVIRVNMAKMGVIIQNPKDLFTEWSNEDYNAIADNLNKKANELYASAEKDSKAITSGITDSVKRGEHFMSIAMGAAQKAVAQDQLVQSIAQAYFTGGMAGIQQMVKDKIRDAFIDKVAEATGLNPDLVRFASGRFEQAKLNKKMNSQAAKIGTGVGVMASLALGPVGPLMMAGPMGGAMLGAGAGGKLGSSLSGGTMRSILNNPVTDAALTMSAGVSGAMMGGPAGLVAGVAAKNKFMKSNSVVSNNNQYNALQQQENALIQDAAGQAVANAIGRPDAAGNFSQILGGLKKRQVAKRDNANLGKVASKGVASALNMANGMVKGIVRNAVIAVGGKTDTFDQLTASPFTPPATWTGAAKVDMSKDGLMNRAQEMAYAKFLENNGMDTGLANIVASGMNGKIKAAKAKKEEKTKAIESTAQTALAITAIALTGGGAGPALGSVLTGGASGTFYAVQGANIALQAAIGSRTGGPQGALAGVVNGTLQALAATNFGKLAEGADKLVGKADEIQSMAINNPLIAKTMAATNVSYSKENGWGIKANVSGVVNAIGVKGSALNDIMKKFNSVTIGQSQRGGATVNLGISTGSGTLGVNYTGASGKFDGSFDVMERQAGTGKLSAELNYGEDGFSVSGNADLGNGLGFGLESGRNGTTGSLTILGSQQGTVDENGNYEANANFLGEISGQDIIDLNKTRQDQRDAEENERNPVKTAKDAADSKDAKDKKDGKDDDAKEVGGEEGPSGLVDLAFAGLGVVMSAGAAFLAGGGSSSASPSAPASGQGAAGNGGNASTVGRKPEDEKDGKVKGEGDTKDEPPKKQPTKEELANFKDNIFWNTTRAATDDYLAKLDAQGVDTSVMRAHAEAQRAAGVRDLTPSEIQAKKLNKELAALRLELDKASTIAQDDSILSEGINPIQQQLNLREEYKQKIADKEREIKSINQTANDNERYNARNPEWAVQQVKDQLSISKGAEIKNPAPKDIAIPSRDMPIVEAYKDDKLKGVLNLLKGGGLGLARGVINGLDFVTNFSDNGQVGKRKEEEAANKRNADLKDKPDYYKTMYQRSEILGGIAFGIGLGKVAGIKPTSTYSSSDDLANLARYGRTDGGTHTLGEIYSSLTNQPFQNKGSQKAAEYIMQGRFKLGRFPEGSTSLGTFSPSQRIIKNDSRLTLNQTLTNAAHEGQHAVDSTNGMIKYKKVKFNGQWIDKLDSNGRLIPAHPEPKNMKYPYRTLALEFRAHKSMIDFVKENGILNNNAVDIMRVAENDRKLANYINKKYKLLKGVNNEGERVPRVLKVKEMQYILRSKDFKGGL